MTSEKRHEIASSLRWLMSTPEMPEDKDNQFEWSVYNSLNTKKISIKNPLFKFIKQGLSVNYQKAFEMEEELNKEVRKNGCKAPYYVPFVFIDTKNHKTEMVPLLFKITKIKSLDKTLYVVPNDFIMYQGAWRKFAWSSHSFDRISERMSHQSPEELCYFIINAKKYKYKGTGGDIEMEFELDGRLIGRSPLVECGEYIVAKTFLLPHMRSFNDG